VDLMQGDRLVDIEAEEGMYRLVEVPVRDSHQLRIQIDEPTNHIKLPARLILVRRH
jgi:hypothetical protein